MTNKQGIAKFTRMNRVKPGLKVHGQKSPQPLSQKQVAGKVRTKWHCVFQLGREHNNNYVLYLFNLLNINEFNYNYNFVYILRTK